MKDSFLENFIKTLLPTKDFTQTCIILPSSYDIIFFLRIFYRLQKKSCFTPQMYSLHDFICKHATMIELKEEALIFQLYHSFKKEFTTSFDDFISIAPIILHDFNSIEMHIEDKAFHSFFQNLSDIASIDRWSEKLGKEKTIEESSTLKNYLDYWKKLESVFKDYRNILFKKKQGYKGLVYRSFYENMEDFLKKKSDFTFYFLGYDLKTQLELKIFEKIQKLLPKENYTYIVDSDTYFFNHTDNPVGKNLSHGKNIFTPYPKFASEIENTPKKIQIIKASPPIEQMEEVKKIILQNVSKNNEETMGIVLMDRDELMPLLYSLPLHYQEEKIDYNILISIKATETHSYFFFSSLFELHKQVTLHQYIPTVSLLSFFEKNKQLFYSCRDLFAEMKKYILTYKKNKLSFDEVIFFDISKKNNFLTNIFQYLLEKDTRKNLYLLPSLIFSIKEIVKNTFIDEELVLQEFAKNLENIKENIMESDIEDISLTAIYHYLEEIFENISIPLESKNTSKIYILSLYHTSMIDFDTVIFLSCNEGILPKVKTESSFIPFQACIEQGIFSYREQEAFISYLFFRLLKRGKYIYILYQGEYINEKTNEYSRFITQIKEELKNPDIKIEEKPIPTPISKLIPLDLSMPKDNYLIKLLKQKLSERLSATSVLNYIQNPINFIFKYLFKIKKETSFEVMQPMDMGNIIHAVLKTFFQPHLNKEIDMKSLAGLINKEKIAHILEEEMKNYPKIISLEKGRDFLNFRNILQLILLFLEEQKQELQKKPEENFSILFLEKKLTASLPVKLKDNSEIFVNLYGEIDRIDFLNKINTYRIIDYKISSNISIPKLKDIKEIFSFSPDDSSNRVKRYYIQLYIYKYLLLKSMEAKKNTLPQKFDEINIKCGIYFLKNDRTIKHIDQPNLTNQKFCEEMEKTLSKIVTEMLDMGIPLKEHKEIDSILK